MPRPRRRRAAAEPLHERLAHDLPFNAQVAEAEVVDPYSPAGETHRLKVLRSIRDDPLAGLLSRRVIDQAQFQAGRKFEHLVDLTGFGAICAMDPTKEPVDGRGAEADRLTDRQIKAAQTLRRAAEHLGREGSRLAHEILAEGLMLSAVVERRGLKPSTEAERYYGRRFRECLESLAQLWGFATCA